MMENFLIYIGKTSIATATFYLAYLILFQNQKHFDFNRLYLLLSLLLSFIIPLITIPLVKLVDIAISNHSGSSMVYLPSTTVSSVPFESSFSPFHYLLGGFVLGILAFSLHLIISHFKAIRIISNCRVVQLFGSPVHITSKDVHPFSFFNKIVISEKMLSGPDLEMIVSHEKIHVQEKHTIDIFLVELMFLLQWFNPFAWLIKDAIRNNLEYKTDNEITKKYNPQKYQLAMLALADKNEVSPFLTALNGSQLKNRIIMMKKKTQTKLIVVKQLMVVPLLVVLIIGLSNKEVISKPVQEKKAVAVDSNNEQVVGNETSGSNDWSISGGLKGEFLTDNNSDGMKLTMEPDDDMVLRFSKESNGSYPPIYVDGVRFETNKTDFNFENATINEFAKLIKTKPEDIESIEVLKGESVKIFLGNDSDAESVLLIKTNDETINTSLELRKAIATRMKFPVDAADINSELLLSFYATMNERGEITNIQDEIAENTQFITVDEVVIVAYRIKSDVQKSENVYKELLGNEAKRVLKDLPQFNIPEMNGKVVKFQFRFKTE